MEEKKNNDMNLFDLIVLCCKAIGRLFRYCGHFLKEMLRLSYRRWYIVLPVVLLGIAVALYWARPTNRMYKVGTMVHLNGVQANDVKQQWAALYKATPANISQQQSVAQLLQIDDSIALGLSRFQCFNVIDCKCDTLPDFVDFKKKHSLSDTVDVVMDDYLYLQFRTKNPQNFVEIGKATIAYLNSNPLMQQAFSNYQKTLQQKVLFCQQQIEMMDSITRNFYFHQTPDKQYVYQGGSSILIGRREIRMLHQQILPLMDNAIKAEYLYSIAQAPVVPVADFTITPVAVNGPIRCSILGIIIGYLLGCLLALLVERRKAIHAWLSRKE